MKTGIYCLLVFFLTCCKPSSQKKITEYYSNGIKKREQEMNGILKHGKETIFYQSGKVRSISYWEHDTINGIGETYYENGQVETMEIISKGRRNGLYSEYYADGSLKTISTYSNGYAIGNRTFYYKNGNISRIDYNQIVRNKNIVGQYIVFDKGGNIIKNKSSYLTIIPKNDTIVTDKDYEVTIKLENPFYQNIRAVIANYDEQFVLLNKHNIDTIVGNNSQVIIKREDNKIGDKVIRGYIDDFLIDYSKDQPLEVGHEIYFEITYHVKDKEDTIELGAVLLN